MIYLIKRGGRKRLEMLGARRGEENIQPLWDYRSISRATSIYETQHI
jgi:hypothetical protein